jgi:hypothetical protein
VTNPEARRRSTANEPMDEGDFAVLRDIHEMFLAVDPMPANLPERIRFSLALRELEFEVARLSAEEDDRVLVARGAEQSRTITFDSESLTIMIRIDLSDDGTARLDGWIAPPQRRVVDLRTGSDQLTVDADERGRFVFSRVPRGSAQLVVRAEPGQPGSGPTVVTPALIL